MKGAEGPLSACINMPLPFVNIYFLLKFSCFCGKILVSFCVFFLISFSDVPLLRLEADAVGASVSS